MRISSEPGVINVSSWWLVSTSSHVIGSYYCLTVTHKLGIILWFVSVQEECYWQQLKNILIKIPKNILWYGALLVWAGQWTVLNERPKNWDQNLSMLSLSPGKDVFRISESTWILKVWCRMVCIDIDGLVSIQWWVKAQWVGIFPTKMLTSSVIQFVIVTMAAPPS